METPKGSVPLDYATCNTTADKHRRDFLFYPRGKVIRGTVRVMVSTDYLYSSKAPMQHEKVVDALTYAARHHPNFAVSLTLLRTKNRGGPANSHVFHIGAASVGAMTESW